MYLSVIWETGENWRYGALPALHSVFSPFLSFVCCHLLPYFVCSASHTSLLLHITHLPSHSLTLGWHLDSPVFAENRRERRKLLAVQLLRNFPTCPGRVSVLTAQKPRVLRNIRSRRPTPPAALSWHWNLQNPFPSWFIQSQGKGQSDEQTGPATSAWWL